ncbi:MAG: DUF4417 domain-containing protein, partial [Prevotella sp.]|nr:DUF4417 domain-containing protein [Prevotella sp.]
MDEKVIDIEELAQDAHNFNKGNEQGQQLMERSFKELGAGRSILLDRNGNIIAGNKSQQAAIAAGIKKVRVIETTGDELVAVKRTDVDIDSAEGRKMAYLDNLTTQVNLTWDQTELEAVQADVEGFEVADFGFDIADLAEVSDIMSYNEEDDGTDEKPTKTKTKKDAPAEETDEEETDPEKIKFYLKMLGDYVYPSNNEFDIPTLLTDNMPVHLELPINPWGAEARYKKGMMTYHFYVDDYRFEQLFKDPIKLLQSGCRAIVEPNCSIHDQTPMAHAIWQTYRKRYLCRYLQECGMQIWVDLNVSPHFEEINALGVPEGYNAFCTRGVTGWLNTTERHWEMAKRISGLDKPNMFVYGGGDDVAEWCKAHDVVYVNEFINRAKDKTEE